jgi:exopolyphosphatase/guanosine-5'-triphosphate,3'-diphosphate pyrophosphatase
LANFGQRLRNIPAKNIRIVGTNTLRQAKNSKQFIKSAEKLLGHPIEIISGREEARLVYLGAAHSLGGPSGKRLVIDIGGGSTELVIGEGFEAEIMESIWAGCVSASKNWFADGMLTKKRFKKARIDVQSLLEPYMSQFSTGWNHVVGTSGTIRAIGRVAVQNSWSQSGITPDALKNIEPALINAEHVDSIELQGLGKKRQPVFPGGFAVLSALFDAFAIKEMHVADGALREGLIFDMLGRHHEKDVRIRTITNMIKRYGIDKLHAEFVKQTALFCLAQVSSDLGITNDEWAKMLSWAAELHEIGLDISHQQYQKHGAYIISNSDMMGFSRLEQDMLAVMVQSQRNKLDLELFAFLPEDWESIVLKLTIILRISIALQRSRMHKEKSDFTFEFRKQRIILTFPNGWLDERPLTVSDLQQERKYLKDINIELSFN